jgi:hypothetical protein
VTTTRNDFPVLTISELHPLDPRTLGIPVGEP